MDNHDIDMPVAKAASAIAAAGLSWSEVAAALAGFYTFLLIIEWFWKRLWRPLLERKGWLRPKRRVIVSESEWARLRPEGE
jgi:hypothetical protein